MEDNALRREKAKEKGQEKVDDIKKKRRKRRHEREMQECFTRVLGDASSRMAPNLDKYFGPMLEYMKNNNNDELERLEERRIRLDIVILESRKAFELLDKCKRLRDDIEHEESRKSPDNQDIASLRAELRRCSPG